MSLNNSAAPAKLEKDLERSKSFSEIFFRVLEQETMAMALLGRIFGTAKEESPDVINAMDKLNEQLSMLEKREKLYEKRIVNEKAKALQLAKAQNKRGALACLKKSKLCEKELENILNQQNRIYDQIMVLESAQATTETVVALRHGAEALKTLPNVNEVDKVLDQIAETNDVIKQVQDLLAEPVIDYDEDELDQELASLELEEDVLEPSPLPSVPEGKPVEKEKTENKQVEKKQQPQQQLEAA